MCHVERERSIESERERERIPGFENNVEKLDN